MSETSMIKKYIRNITVSVNENETPPAHHIGAQGGKSDINAGFGGRFVYLVAEETHNSNHAATDFFIEIVSNAQPDKVDMAAGSGGKYRYLIVKHNHGERKKVTAVALYRKPNGAGAVTQDEANNMGFNRLSSDINEGRGGDYLHLVYNVEDCGCD